MLYKQILINYSLQTKKKSRMMYAFPSVFNQPTKCIVSFFLQIRIHPTNSVQWKPTIKQKIGFLIIIFCRLAKKVNSDKTENFFIRQL